MSRFPTNKNAPGEGIDTCETPCSTFGDFIQTCKNDHPAPLSVNSLDTGCSSPVGAFNDFWSGNCGHRSDGCEATATDCLEESENKTKQDLDGDGVPDCVVEDDEFLYSNIPDVCPDQEIRPLPKKYCGLNDCKFVCDILDKFRFRDKPRLAAIMTAIARNIYDTSIRFCLPFDSCVIGRLWGFDCVQCEGSVTKEAIDDGMNPVTVCTFMCNGFSPTILPESGEDGCFNSFTYEFNPDDEFYNRMLYTHIHYKHLPPTNGNTLAALSYLFDAPVSVTCDCQIMIHRELTEKEKSHILIVQSIIPFYHESGLLNFLKAD